MRRLNVREAQIDTCIRESMFALSEKPRNPELQSGELLLLQLVKNDARRLGRLQKRINFALVFDRIVQDHDGTLSRLHWPNEGRVWNWILYGSATIPTVPFSLEGLGLSRDYQGQDNARYIDPPDQEVINPRMLWSLAQSPSLFRPKQIVDPDRLAQRFGGQPTLSAIFNHDHIVLLDPASTARIIAERTSIEVPSNRNPWLADSLKSFYEHRCQICGNDFEPRFGSRYAESHHIQYIREGGPDISANMIVLCPNHHRIIHTTDAKFDTDRLLYEYPNGLREPLANPTHLILAPRSVPAGSSPDYR